MLPAISEDDLDVEDLVIHRISEDLARVLDQKDETLDAKGRTLFALLNFNRNNLISRVDSGIKRNI